MPYVDDPDQLPELPEPGPRDGWHGVDRDSDYDPFPPLRVEPGRPIIPLRVPITIAATHLSVLVDRVWQGEDVILMRNGHAVARLTSVLARTPSTTVPVVADVEPDAAAAMSDAEADAEAAGTTLGARMDAQQAAPEPEPEPVREFEGEEQLPELPDPGPRDGRHGVDGTKPIRRRAKRLPH